MRSRDVRQAAIAAWQTEGGAPGISFTMLRFPLMLVSLLLLCFASAQAAVTVNLAILFGSVKGKVESSKPDYIAKSDRQFDVVVDDAPTRALWPRLPSGATASTQVTA
ncbi:MAG: hypothetical protein ACO1NN_02570 [Sphingopyxis sp.]